MFMVHIRRALQSYISILPMMLASVYRYNQSPIIRQGAYLRTK